MKKLLLSLLVVVFSLTQLVAQDPIFIKGDKVLNLGIGLGSSHYSSFYTSRLPAVSASFEVGVLDGILEKGSVGVGGYFGFSSAKYSTYWKTTNVLLIPDCYLDTIFLTLNMIVATLVLTVHHQAVLL
jgi:hypothetical protein